MFQTFALDAEKISPYESKQAESWIVTKLVVKVVLKNVVKVVVKVLVWEGGMVGDL